jgi:catechol 2,3-dioxygenase-like lactoylglutathione lyase family enzyme
MPETIEVLQDYILGPAHIGFIVPDLDEALAEASRVYGLEREAISLQPPPGEKAASRFAFFCVGGLQFEYIQPCSDYLRQMLLEMPSGGGGINHVAWRVRDIETCLGRLLEHGILPGHVTPEGVVSIGANKMVYLDPATTAGQVIELIEFGESEN